MISRRHYLIPLLLLLIGLFPLPVQSQQPVFRIGVFGEANSSIGRGARLIAEQLNTQGGVQGADGTLFRLELIFTSMENPGNAVSQLSTAGIIAAIGPANSVEAAAITPQLPALNVPVLTAATDDGLIINDQSGLLFRVRASNFFTERALADYLLNNARIPNADVIQFDVDSTVNVLGFTSAYQSVGGTPANPILVNTPDLVTGTIQDIVNRSPLAVVTYGNTANAGAFYLQLRGAGYTGVFTHPQGNTPAFRGEFPPEVTAGIVSSNTWSIGATDAASTTFLAGYVRTYAQIPDAVAAAGADAMLLLSEAIGLPGELRANLSAIQGLSGIQGTVARGGRTAGELSDNTFVVQLNEFGSPVVQERFLGTERVPLGEGGGIQTALEPTATPLPDGVFVTITSNVQNVRSGPSTSFATIGQLQQNNTVQVIGANTDFSWLVIEFRGQQGWIANLASLNEVIGELNTLDIITPPPTPTPPPFPTALPVTEPDLVIQSASISPNPIVAGQPFTLTVTVINRGGSLAGASSISVTMPPDNLFLSSSIGGLAPDQSTTVNLEGTLDDDGNFSAIILADANNQVPEGAGENNNGTFNFSYEVSEGSSGSRVQIEDGETFTLSSADNTRIRWNGDEFEAVDGGIGRTAQDFDDVDADDINSDNADEEEIDPNEGDVIIVRANDGDKAVIRVDELQDDGDVIITYKTFND